MTDFLLDTDTVSRLIRKERASIRAMRRSGATSVAVSTITRSELLYGAHLKPEAGNLLASVRTFLTGVEEFDWDSRAAEHHSLIRAEAQRVGRGAGLLDIMIAAHALALGRTLVTSDRAIHRLGIKGLALADWSK